MKEYFKQWWFVGILVIIGGFLIVTGIVFDFIPSTQVLTKKLFLVGLFYLTTYIIRVSRLGHIDWEEESGNWRKIYYFVLMFCVALIIALG